MFPRLGAHTLLAYGAAVAASSVAAQAPEPQDGIEEIVVVAQKREQIAQDVGIAVTALSGRSLRERGIGRPEDLYQLIPNTSMQNNGGGGAPVLIVRGVGLQSFRINDSPTTAFYVDDVYQTSVASAEWTMFDIDHVEVLKGPQGGLYGRNAIGSAIQIISVSPDLGGDRNGYASLRYSEYAESELEGATSFSFSDKAALRVAAHRIKSGASPYRSVPSGLEIGRNDRSALRATLRLEPSDSIDVTLRATSGSDDSELPPLRTLGVYANVGMTPSLSLALLGGLRGQIPRPLCPSILAGLGADGSSCATVSGRTPAALGLRSDEPLESASAFRGFLQNSWTNVGITAEFDLGDYRLQSITARDSIDYRRFQDFDGTPFEHLHIDYHTDIEVWSQELRLFREVTDELNWVVGANYAKDDLEENTPLYGAQGVLPLLFAGATFSPQNYVQSTEALAVYGHAEWRFSEPFNLIGELRYTDEDKTFAGGARLGFANGATVPFLSTDDATQFQAVSGKVALEWTLDEELLAYAALSRGFKTGGFYGGFPTSIDQLRPFDAETIWALELGLKSDWNDGRIRLNGSVYSYDRSDVQQNAADPASSISIKRITNIGDVDTVGIEVELTWLASDRLSLAVGVGTTDAEVAKSSFIQASSLPLLPDTRAEGTNLPNYAQRSASFVGRYEAPLGDGKAELFVQLEGRYQSEQDLSVITQPIEAAVFREPGYTLWNARLGIGAPNRRWQAQLFVANLTDEAYRVLARNDGAFGIHELYGLPRIWGVSYQQRWE